LIDRNYSSIVLHCITQAIEEPFLTSVKRALIDNYTYSPDLVLMYLKSIKFMLAVMVSHCPPSNAHFLLTNRVSDRLHVDQVHTDHMHWWCGIHHQLTLILPNPREWLPGGFAPIAVKIDDYTDHNLNSLGL